MYTISNIISDIDRGIMAHNMVEDWFNQKEKRFDLCYISVT